MTQVIAKPTRDNERTIALAPGVWLHDGVRYELCADGLHVQRMDLLGHHEEVISFEDVLAKAEGQLFL
jgi:hypothetical protein